MPRRKPARRKSPSALGRGLVVAAALALSGGGWAIVSHFRAKESARDVALAEGLIARGDPAQAARVLEDMRRRGEDPVEGRIVLAVAYGKVNDPRALAAAKGAVAVAPDSLRAHLALLSSYTRVFDKPNVLAELQVAERLAPRDNTELCLFGAHYGASGHDYGLVAEQARRCVAIDPKLAQAWYYLGLSLAQASSSSSWTQAETSLRQSLALAQDFYPAWLELGHVYIRLRRDAEAVDCLERARATLGSLPSAAGDTRQRLQDLIRIDHLLLEAYHHQGQSAKEEELRRECDALNERVQHLPAT